MVYPQSVEIISDRHKVSQYKNSLGQPIGEPITTQFPRPVPGQAAMQGRYCSVVPVDIESQAEQLFNAYIADTENRIWTYLPYGPFADIAAFKSWMQSTCHTADPHFHTILNASGVAVGLASYLRITPESGVIEVGHINYSPALQSTTAATEAMYLMMCRVFDELGYRRYEWKCDSLNEGSQRAARRLGFCYEGKFMQATHYKGRNRDTAWFGIVDKDWPTIKAGFERWLAAENFDNQGRQLTPLVTRV